MGPAKERILSSAEPIPRMIVAYYKSHTANRVSQRMHTEHTVHMTDGSHFKNWQP